MKIKKLLETLPVTLFNGSRELELKGICGHSKRVAPGDLFLSRKSPRGEEELHIEEACSAGALAVLTDFPDPSRKDVAQLVCTDVRALEGKLASLFYGHPSKQLECIGITGTNGKTSTSFLIHYLLESEGKKCGLMGTIENRIGQQSFPSELTTPEASTVHRRLREMVEHHCKAMVMEVSSIGIDQKRVEEVDFERAVFTNFSQDHLDYHGTMEAYRACKQRLFTHLKKEGLAIVNYEDPASAFMLEKCSAPSMSFGFHKEATLSASSVVYQQEKTVATCLYRGKSARLELPLIGAFNLSNALAALCVHLSFGGDLEQGCFALKTFPGVPGRFQQVPNDKGVHVVVDYAHSPDAIERLCSCARAIFSKRIFLVVGAGGNRDQKKRPLMTKAARPYVDYMILTQDNPREEDPLSICEQMAQNLDQKEYEIELDRAVAIKKAIERAAAGDLILITGKGHETAQVIGKIAHPFDDFEVAREYLC